MNQALALIEGKKTHLLVLLYVVMLLATNQPIAGDAIVGNIDAGAIKDALLVAMVSTAKAGFDRFVKKNGE